MHKSVNRLLMLMLTLLAALTAPGAASAQQGAPASAPSLVFDQVTVIDVEHGKRLPEQRVVVTGNRITAVGAAGRVAIPTGAQVVDAAGKYLIPGLWDMHVHHATQPAAAAIFQQLFLAHGVLGVRDAGTPIPLATTTQWLREVLAGQRIGLVRPFFSGQSFGDPQEWRWMQTCERAKLPVGLETCVADEADAIHVIDSLKAAGAKTIKTRGIHSLKLYYAAAREARRLGLPSGGHIDPGLTVTVQALADSGVTFIDHLSVSANIGFSEKWHGATADSSPSDCLLSMYHNDGVPWTPGTATVARCRPVAAHLAKRNTWFVPTLSIYGPRAPRPYAILRQMRQAVEAFWADSLPGSTTAGPVLAHNWLRGAVVADTVGLPGPDSIGILSTAQKAGLPMLAGTDDLSGGAPAGFGLHEELALLVAEGVTPLTALQAATIGPAKALRVSDSLGTVARGKLADLVLLDADPLADITNTTTIRAVVANGRYFDRAALDRVLVGVRADSASRCLRDGSCTDYR